LSAGHPISYHSFIGRWRHYAALHIIGTDSSSWFVANINIFSQSTTKLIANDNGRTNDGWDPLVKLINGNRSIPDAPNGPTHSRWGEVPFHTISIAELPTRNFFCSSLKCPGEMVTAAGDPLPVRDLFFLC
jgi:hypothetical protein